MKIINNVLKQANLINGVSQVLLEGSTDIGGTLTIAPNQIISNKANKLVCNFVPSDTMLIAEEFYFNIVLDGIPDNIIVIIIPICLAFDGNNTMKLNSIKINGETISLDDVGIINSNDNSSEYCNSGYIYIRNNN